MIFSDENLLKFLKSKFEEINKKFEMNIKDEIISNVSNDNLCKLEYNCSAFLQTQKYRKFISLLKEHGTIEAYLKIVTYIELMCKYDYVRTVLIQLSQSISKKSPLPNGFSLPVLILGLFPNLFFCSRYIHDAITFESLAKDINSRFWNKDEKNNFDLVNDHLKAIHAVIRYLEIFSLHHEYLFLDRHFYRDHLMHSLRVMWLMTELFAEWKDHYLTSCFLRLKRLCDGLSKEYETIFKKAVYSDPGFLYRQGRTNCLFAGLFHDISYPLKAFTNDKEDNLDVKWIDEHLEQVSKLSIPTLEQEFTFYKLKLAIGEENGPVDKIYSCEEVTKSFDNRKADLAVKEMLRSKMHDHGVYSSMIVRNLYLEAIQAIATHNLCEIKIDFSEKPISYMLVLCDELQEWGRWSLNKGTDKYFVPIHEVDLNITNKSLNAKIDYSKNKEEIEENYNEFNVIPIIKSKYKNLKRLVISNDLPISFDIEIEIIDLKENSHKITYCQETKKWSTDLTIES